MAVSSRHQSTLIVRRTDGNPPIPDEFGGRWIGQGKVPDWANDVRGDINITDVEGHGYTFRINGVPIIAGGEALPGAPPNSVQFNFNNAFTGSANFTWLNDRLGILTDNPLYPLDVRGNVNSTGCYYSVGIPFACYDSATGKINLSNINTINDLIPGGLTNPAPPERSIQFNDQGAFGGTSNLTWSSANTLYINGNINTTGLFQTHGRTWAIPYNVGQPLMDLVNIRNINYSPFPPPTVHPGGPDNSIQYNNDGDFWGSSYLIWEDDDHLLYVGGHNIPHVLIGPSEIIFNRGSDQTTILWLTNGATRWSLETLGQETGINSAGNNLTIRRTLDNGTTTIAMQINRATGFVGFGQISPPAYQLDVNGSCNIRTVSGSGYYSINGTSVISASFDASIFYIGSMIWDVNTDAIGVHRPPDTTGYWPSPVSNVNPHVNLDVEGSVNVEWENPAPPLVGQPVNFRGYCINGFGCLGTIDGQDRNLWNIHNIIAPVTPVFTIDATNAFFQGRFNASVNYNWEDAQVFYYRNLSWNAGNQFSLTAGQDGGMVSVTQGSAPWVYTPENPLPPPPPPPGWESDKVKILRLTAAEFEGNSTWIEIDTSHHIIFYVNSEEVLAFPPHGNITLNKLRTTNPGSGTRQLWADPADGFRVKWAGPGS